MARKDNTVARESAKRSGEVTAGEPGVMDTMPNDPAEPNGEETALSLREPDTGAVIRGLLHQAFDRLTTVTMENLERIDSGIDTLCDQTEKTAALVEKAVVVARERHESIVHHLKCQGLHPSVAMRDN